MASKRIHEKDIFETYKASYRIKFDWTAILPDNIREWLNTFEKATNCPKALVMSALISMTACLTGPKTEVKSNDSYKTSMNTFLIAVCDPGGGKSTTFDRVISPVMETIEQKYGFKICIESYTTAGIHKQQQDSGGYGFIASDEGERFLSLVNQKQRQGESERALLCKMWQGKGDSTTLSTGTRGFSSTSMSTCILIQPHNLMHELLQLSGDDGIMDRFLIVSARPVFNKTAELREGFMSLEASKMQEFTALFSHMMSHHKTNKITYNLDDAAQQYYNGIVDNYAALISEKYNSESGKY